MPVWIYEGALSRLNKKGAAHPAFCAAEPVSGAGQTEESALIRAPEKRISALLEREKSKWTGKNDGISGACLRNLTIFKMNDLQL